MNIENNKNVKNRELTEEKILEATAVSIRKIGWNKITISMVAREANVSRRIINKYFRNINGLKRAYIQKYDFWFRQRENLKNPTFNTKSLQEVRAFVKKLFTDLFNYFNESEEMRVIMLEELNQKSPFFAEIHNSRQDAVNAVANISSPFFKRSRINIRAVLVNLIGSTYHPSLRGYKNGSISAGIQITKQEGRQEMLNDIFDTLDHKFSGCPEMID